MTQLNRSFAALFAAVLSVSAPITFAQETPAAAAPTTAPSLLVPAPEAAASVSPEAKALLDKLSTAVSNAKALTASGTFNADIDVAGQKQTETKAFSSSYSQPVQFRHEVKDELILGGTGEKIYAYKPTDKQYLLSDSPKEHVAATELPQLVPQILRTQNLMLLMALTTNSTAELTRGATKVSRGEDTKIDDAACPTVLIESPDGAQIAMAMNPRNDLIRRVTIDFSKVLTARQAPDVKKALLVTDYATVTTDAPENVSYAWVPPEGATDVAKQAAAEQQGGDPSALVGKPAPDFTLKDESGADVKLSSLKGSVVVVDFWATWCGPCREGLPHLDKLLEARKDKGLKVYALNLKETPDQVKKFKEQTGLKLPVIFDTDGKVAEAYQVTGIPLTILVGKDGIVRKANIGFEAAAAEKFNAEVDAALEAK